MSQNRVSMRVAPGGGAAKPGQGRASILNKGAGPPGFGAKGRASILNKASSSSSSKVVPMHTNASAAAGKSDSKVGGPSASSPNDYATISDEEEQETNPFLMKVKILADFIDEPHSIYEWVYHLAVNIFSLFYVIFIVMETIDGPNHYNGRKDKSRFPFLPNAEQYYIIKLTLTIPLMVHLVLQLFCSLCLLKINHLKEIYLYVSSDLNYFFEYCSMFVADALLFIWFCFQVIVRFTDAWPYTGSYAISMFVYFIVDYLRFLQFYKSFRNISTFIVVSNALNRIISVISAPIFVFICVNIIFGGFMYYFDSCYNDEVCPFPNLLQSTFFCIVSMTTTGYGNQTPQWCYSQLFAVFIMLCGAPYLAIPIGIIDAEFSESYEEEQENENERRRILSELTEGDEGGDLDDEALLQEDDDVKTVEFRKGRLLSMYCELSELVFVCTTTLDSFKEVLDAELIQDKYASISSIYNHNNNIFQNMAFQLSRLQKLCSVFSGEVGIICGLSVTSGGGGSSNGRRGAASFAMIQALVPGADGNADGGGEKEREKRPSVADHKSENADTVALLLRMNQEAITHPIKSAVRLFVECPESSVEATLYNYLIIICVLISIVLMFWQTMISFVPHGEGSSICESVTDLYCKNKYDNSTDPGCYVHESGTVTSQKLEFYCGGSKCYGYEGNWGSGIDVTCASDVLPFRTQDLLKKVLFSFNREQIHQNYDICHRLECSSKIKLYFDANDIWLAVETFINVIFVIDLGLQVFLASSFREYFLNPMNIVDLLAIVPFFFELIEALATQRSMRFQFLSSAPDLKIISIGKLLKVFRVLKLFRKFKGGQIVAKVIMLSWKDIFRFYSIIFVVMTCYGILLHYSTNAKVCFYNEDCPAELYLQDKVLAMQFLSGQRVLYRDDMSLPYMYNALYGAWFSAVTMTSTGYGDLLPQSPQSYILAAILMLFGTFFTAIPLSIVNRNFQTYYALMKSREKTKAVALEGFVKQRVISKKEKNFKKRVTEVQAMQATHDSKSSSKEKNNSTSTILEKEEGEEDENKEVIISTDKIQREFDKILKAEKIKKVKVPQEDYRIIIKDYSSYSAHISVEIKHLLKIMTAQQNWQKMRTSVQSLIKLKSIKNITAKMLAFKRQEEEEEDESEEDEEGDKNSSDGDKPVGDGEGDSSSKVKNSALPSGGAKVTRKSIRKSINKGSNPKGSSISAMSSKLATATPSSILSPSKLLFGSNSSVSTSAANDPHKKSEIEELLMNLTALNTRLEALNKMHLTHSYKIRFLSGIEQSRGQLSSISRDSSIITLLKSSVLTNKVADGTKTGSGIVIKKEETQPASPIPPTSGSSPMKAET